MKKLKLTLAIIVSFVGAMSLLAQSASAASAKLYLSPATANVSHKSSLTVDIRVNTGGEEVNVVKAVLSYPADKLDFEGITYSEAFNFPVQEEAGDGKVRITRGAVPPISGDHLVASVSFKPKVSSGSLAISFTDESAVSNKQGQAILGSTEGGTYSIKPAEDAPPVNLKDVDKPVIKNIKVAEVTIRGASISWQTSEPATSEIHYGLNTKYGLTVADDDLTLNHVLVLDSVLLRPDTQYHYRIKTVDAAGNESYSSDRTFTTLAATTGSINSSADRPQPAIFNSQPQSRLPHPLPLTIGLISLVMSGGLLLLSLQKNSKKAILSLDKLLVSELSKQHRKLLKRLFHT